MSLTRHYPIYQDPIIAPSMDLKCKTARNLEGIQHFTALILKNSNLVLSSGIKHSYLEAPFLTGRVKHAIRPSKIKQSCDSTNLMRPMQFDTAARTLQSTRLVSRLFHQLRSSAGKNVFEYSCFTCLN